MARGNKLMMPAVPASVAREDREYRARNDMRTLQEAEKIRADSARMRAVGAAAKKEMEALSKVLKPARSKTRR